LGTLAGAKTLGGISGCCFSITLGTRIVLGKCWYCQCRNKGRGGY
jgi:hypothetical protein